MAQKTSKEEKVKLQQGASENFTFNLGFKLTTELLTIYSSTNKCKSRNDIETPAEATQSQHNTKDAKRLTL